MIFETYRHPGGRIIMEIPTTPNYRAEVALNPGGYSGIGARAEYRKALHDGRIGDVSLTEHELEWLQGFNDDVAQLEQQYAHGE